MLLDKGADPNMTDRDGVTPLHYAAQGGALKICELLLEKGADWSAENEDLETPLHLAADAGHTEEDHAGHDHSLPTKEDVKKHLVEDKKNRAIEKQRLSTIEKIIEASKIPVPRILVEAELEKMLGQFESDIARMGIQSKDYFAHIKKTPEELKADWAPDAEKRVKTDIILAEIAKTEKISPDKTKVDYEIAQIISMHPEADPLRARVYVEHMLTNQAVFSFLEER
jgi:ankyrin repeat protein